MKKTIKICCVPEDRERLQPLAEQLRAGGIRISEEAPKKGDVTLAVLSERFYADEAAGKQLLELIGTGAENVLPLQIDAAPIPEKLKNALYARNIISAAGRDDALLAERIAAAIPNKKNPLPLILTLCALALAIAAGLYFWRSGQPAEEPEEAVPVVAEEPVFDAVLPTGVTQEELEAVRCVVIVGDHMKLYTEDSEEARRKSDTFSSDWPDMLYEVANENWDWNSDAPEWYWNEDGSRAEMTSWDLRFIGYMKNLEELHMALVDVTALPDLTNSKKLKTVWALDCRMDGVDWIADSYVSKAQLRAEADYTPLSRNKYLRIAVLEVIGNENADLSGFAPEALEQLYLNFRHVDSVDLSGLKTCRKLQNIGIDSAPLRDLEFLRGNLSLSCLGLNHLNQLTDVSALASLSLLRELNIGSCRALRDYSPVGKIPLLNRFSLYSDERDLYDLSFLATQTKLRYLDVSGLNVPDLAFLESIGENRMMSLSLSLTGHVGDYGGLRAIKEYDRLDIDTDDYIDFALVAPYLEEATVRDLDLRRFRSVDLSALPRVTGSLTLDRCGIEDLSTMPETWEAATLHLEQCSALTSLEGLQNQSVIGNRGKGVLEIVGCPRLADWSAMDGMSLVSLRINGCFTLPNFDSGLSFGNLRLENMEDVTDLSFLDSMDDVFRRNYAFVGMDGLTDLTPLHRLRGTELVVGPQLEEEAAELVKSGNFTYYRVEYPSGGWEWERPTITLQSLDELETLPKSMLRHVEELYIAGDQILDWERYEVNDHWEYGRLVPYLFDRWTGEETPVQTGPITDLSLLSELTGLRRLKLAAQPLTNLDGIQSLESLELFAATYCTQLRDASALFTLQELTDVSLRGSAVSSIQGVQNLYGLVCLDIMDTKVTDLSPLAECDFSLAYERGGLDLDINDLDLGPDGLSPLGGIRMFNNLNFTNQDPAVWMPLLQYSQIYSFGAAGDLRNNEALAQFAADHPELRGIWLGGNRGITDLTPLLGMENLDSVGLDGDMTEAIASLEGQAYRFELRIN